MYKLLTALFITLVLNDFIHASPVHSPEFQGNETDKSNEVSLTREEDIDETEYTAELVEEIKSRILKSLHKTEAPKKHVPLPVLQRLNFTKALDKNSENNNRRSGKSKTDFLPAFVDNTCSDYNGIPCINFHFNILPQDHFIAAELWMYKKERVTEFALTHTVRINENEEAEKSTAYACNQTSSKSWIRFDVSNLISEESIAPLNFTIPAENSEIAIEIEDDKKPFLLIHTISELRSVSKRSSYCSNESSTCCKEKYFIKFKDIKWDDWIIQPEEYEANYCKGTCAVNMSNSHHARVFMALCEKNPRKFNLTGKTECLTCVPTGYRPISVIYLDEDGIQVVNHLPDMSVTDCGCV